MKMNRFPLLVGVLLVALASGAWGQDDTWKGAYLGGYAGAGIGRSTASLTTIFPPQHPESTSFTGGFLAGYSLQSGHFVYGAEADVGALNRTDTRTTFGLAVGSSLTQTVSTGWLVTARPRLGYAHGKALFFVTGGLAVTDLKYQGLLTTVFANIPLSLAENKAGWTAGGGLQYKVSRHWSLRGDYLYADFGGLHTPTSQILVPLAPIFANHADAQAHMVRFGVNWHF